MGFIFLLNTWMIKRSLYALPVGQLRKELFQCLRQGKSTCSPRSGGVD